MQDIQLTADRSQLTADGLRQERLKHALRAQVAASEGDTVASRKNRRVAATHETQSSNL
ncbi:hypothetical protein JXM67_00615 [candidate division WOR-3 bacterium]|nr:hypothetical protein [candidate division WOR-3 bacterium]